MHHILFPFIFQQTEALADRQHEVSLLESKYKRADDELECKKQVRIQCSSVHSQV